MFKKEEKDFIKNIDSNGRIRSQFVVADKIIKIAASGRKYIDVNLTDKTGDIVGRMFPDDNFNDVFEHIAIGKIHRIIGNVNEFPRGSGKFNIIISVIKELGEEEYNIEDFIKSSDRNKEEMIVEIMSTIENIENEHLKKLLDSFFDDEKFVAEFCNVPSAKVYHHNYVGGLLEHTAEVLKVCKVGVEIFPELDKDLLYTGAILHDIGKIRTYEYNLIKIDFSNEGKRLDHLFISTDMVKEKIIETKMPDELAIEVLHLILSHHGEVQNGWGSPVTPQTPEALTLHHADNLDAKVKGMIQKIN
ncbi:MAG: HD domain-containing protein [Methanobacterium sp. ERen5]|nr:MAG: HD domain-containing protein [Methanobacterium sp. ERen5]